MVQDHLQDSMKEELESILKEPTYCECFMIKTPLIPLKPNHKTQFLFAGLFTLIFVILLFVLFPTDKQLYVPLAYIIISLLVVLFFVLATVRNPGVIKADKKNFSYISLL
mmetsp:Transcript_18520/g.17615  ORF Transcript_18520/g.17615 Transcript_18520/m.17615 type:complete len:110 (+) Transcript_18520:1177-1506(+)